MASTTPKGLTLWNAPQDKFDHVQLANNFSLIDTLLDSTPDQVTMGTTLPTSGNFNGRIFMLTAADGGFPAYTLVRYDSNAWRNAGHMEILPALPTLNLYPGRVIVLSAASGSFLAWDIVRYDGASWEIVGGWRKVDTGNAATNIKGFQTTGDVYVTDGNRGIILVDRTTGAKRRVFLDAGNLESEVVT